GRISKSGSSFVFYFKGLISAVIGIGNQILGSAGKRCIAAGRKPLTGLSAGLIIGKGKSQNRSRHIGSSRASIIGNHKTGATGLYRYGKFLIGAYPQLLFGAFYAVGKIAGGCKRQGNGVSGSRVVGGELDFQHIAQLQLNGLGGRSVSRVLCLCSSGDGEERSG